MRTEPSPKTPNVLTAEQAADVLRYLEAADGQSLGLVAVQAASSRHSITPDGLPLLTYAEATAGKLHIDSQWPVEPTDEQLEQIESLVDKRPCSVDEAYAVVMGIKPTSWK